MTWGWKVTRIGNAILVVALTAALLALGMACRIADAWKGHLR